MNSSTLLDRFCLWFEGEFDNWEQASSNPSSWAHIFLVHKKIGDRKFYTTSRYNYSNTPYREQEVTIEEDHGIIIVNNPICNLHFSYNGHYFVGGSGAGCIYKDKPFESKAKLFDGEYHTWDEGYWRSSKGFFTFRKKL